MGSIHKGSILGRTVFSVGSVLFRQGCVLVVGTGSILGRTVVLCFTVVVSMVVYSPGGGGSAGDGLSVQAGGGLPEWGLLTEGRC